LVALRKFMVGATVDKWQMPVNGLHSSQPASKKTGCCLLHHTQKGAVQQHQAT
jgi:hypothetical protein